MKGRRVLINQRSVLIMASIMLTFWLGACDNKPTNGNFEKEHYEGKSGIWKVVMDMEDESHKRYNISYIGKGKRPDTFEYKITDSSNEYDYTSPFTGEGELENQEEFSIDISCGSACEPRPKNNENPVVIQWEGRSENVKILQVNQ